MPRPFARALELAAAFILLPLACRTTTNPPNRPDPKEVEFEVLFAEPDHEAEWCLKAALAESYKEVADGTIFFERDATIRIKVPSGPGKEPYHAHLFHRPKDTLVQHLAVQGSNGAIEIPLSKFERPEILIVTSASMRMLDAKDKAAIHDKPLLAPYGMSFRLVPQEQAKHLASLQPFRYEWSHSTAKAALFVQSFNRSDMLLSLLDLTGQAGYLFSDGYYQWKGGDGYLAPRAVVEVVDAQGEVRQRSATYSVPERARAEAKPFALRLAGAELLAFAPPACVQLSHPEERPATAARIAAHFEGVGPKGLHRLVLAAGYPIGSAEKIGVRVQSDEVTAEKHEGSYLVDLSDLDRSSFPMTGFLAHRFVEPWRSGGGFYAPCEPLGRSEVRPGNSQDARMKLHPRIFAPRYASHYDPIFWFGAGGGEDRLKKFLSEYWAAGGGSGSPGGGTPDPWDPSVNVLPPPDTGPGAITATPVGPDGDPSAGGSDAGADPNSPFLLWAPPSECGCGPNGAFCPRPNPCKGHCGVNCPGDGHCKGNSVGDITVTFKCMKKKEGCKQDDPTTKVSECKCGNEAWDSAGLEGGILEAAITYCPPGFVVAETAWSGAHGGSSPCHTLTQVGMARVSYWGPGLTAAHVWFRVWVTFGPCAGKRQEGGNGAGGGGGGGGGGNGGGSGPGGDRSIGRIVQGDDPPAHGILVPTGDGFTGSPTSRWNPSTDPNVVGRLADLVAAFRRGMGLTPLPQPSGRTWGIPTDILFRTPEQLAQGGAGLAQWQRGFETAYWGRAERRRASGASMLRDLLPEWAVGLPRPRGDAMTGPDAGEVPTRTVSPGPR
ncbi:MAG: hypothetical protein HYY17_13230 [Planctomycetes bacterium]|nr:hypothetical protein [Planctomycetota bacterium]